MHHKFLSITKMARRETRHLHKEFNILKNEQVISKMVNSHQDL